MERILATLILVLSITSQAASAPPAWLLDDNGAPLPGVPTSLKGRVCMVECDWTHAPLNNSAEKKLFEGLTVGLGVECIAPNPSQKFYFAHPNNPAFRGLVLTTASFGGASWALTDASYLSGSGQLPKVRDAWVSPTVCVVACAPCVPDWWNTGKSQIISQSVTTLGVSGSCETACNYCTVCASAFRTEVFDALLQQGKLADTIKAIVHDVLWTEMGQPATHPLLPTFTITISEPDAEIRRTMLRQAHVNVAKKVARRANAITLSGQSPSSDFDVFFGKLGGKIDRVRAEEFWIMFNATK